MRSRALIRTPVAAAVAVAAGLAVLLTACSDATPPVAHVPPTTVDLAAHARDHVVAFGSVWVAHADGTVSRVDAGTRVVVQTIDVVPDEQADPAGREDMASVMATASITATADAVWVSVRQAGALARIDPADGSVTRVDPIADPATVTTDPSGAVWTANYLAPTVHRLDADGRIAQSYDVSDRGAAIDLAVTDTDVWVSMTGVQANVHRVRRADGSVHTTTHSHVSLLDFGGIAAAGDTAWVARTVTDTFDVMRTDDTGGAPSDSLALPGQASLHDGVVVDGTLFAANHDTVFAVGDAGRVTTVAAVPGVAQSSRWLRLQRAAGGHASWVLDITNDELLYVDDGSD